MAITLNAGDLNHSENMTQIHSTMSMLVPQFGIPYAQNAAALQFEQKAGIAQPSLIDTSLADLGTFQATVGQQAQQSQTPDTVGNR